MPQETGSTTQGDLFFESLVDSCVTNNPRFLRRDWLAEDVEPRMAVDHFFCETLPEIFRTTGTGRVVQLPSSASPKLGA